MKEMSGEAEGARKGKWRDIWISKPNAKCHLSLEREQVEMKHTEYHILSPSISGNGFFSSI